MKDYSINPLQEFLAVNLDGTIRIADEACRAGVKRIVYLSSIKVNGEINNGSPFLETDMPNPIDPYAISKWRAEQALQDISQHSSLEVVIIRPPLIYGPGVKGNFASMVSWINKGFPTPFGSVQNKRSLVALDNLISLIMVCCANPQAANQIFLVSDNQDLSTSELLRQIARLLKVRILFIPLPTVILRILFFVMGKNALAQRLLGSLQIDISKARALLGWSPPITLEEGLSRAVNFHAEHYL
jgi:nucleoside-diphosphate-sugar epimerase